MNGQLILLLLSMLLQNPGNEVFPGPTSNIPSPGSPAGLPPSTQLPPNGRPIPNHIGWGTDRDNKFCMIIQIAPDAITEFARTSRGQELSEDIPEEIRNRVQRVVFRVGNEPVERVPANLQTLADNRVTPNPTIMNLDGSNPSSLGQLTPIDKPRNPGILTAAQGGTGFPNNGMNSTYNSDQNLLPNTPGSGDWDRSRALGNNPSTAGSSPFDNRLNTAQSQEVLPGATNSTRRDGFNATQPKFPPIFQPNNGNNGNNGTAPVANGSYVSNPPYSPLQNSPIQNSTLQNNNSAPNNFSNNQNGFNSPNRPYVASNTPTPIFGNDSAPYPQNQQLTPSQIQSQQFGQPTQPPAYPATPPYSNQPISFAQLAQMANSKQPTVQQSQHLDLPNEEQAKDKLLPFLLLISIVGNVYLGLWMNHLRTRYRLLLSNMRGVPLSDIA